MTSARPDGWSVLREAGRYLGQDIARWVGNHGALIAGSATAAIALVAVLLFVRRVGARLHRDGDPFGWRSIIGRAIAKTWMLFILIGAARLLVSFGNAPRRIVQAVDFLFTVVATFQFAVWAREVILGHTERRASSDDEAEALRNALGVIRVSVTFVVFAVAFVVALNNVGVNISGLLTGLGIGGLAIGIAARGIFEDLFAALSILFDKPFRRGEMVSWDNTKGVVELIGLKTTRVRSITGEQVIISNANLLNKQLHNLARQEGWRHSFAFGVTYQTPPELFSRIPQIVREVVEAQPTCRLVVCAMTGFGPSSLNFEVHFDILAADLLQGVKGKSATGMALVRRFAEEGIELAYPTQTTFIVGPDGQRIYPYPRPSGERGLRH
jgi:small-conductance mechanosensitive channel